MIVIPMMGKSSRFFGAGYELPKYELELAQRPVLDWVLKSFEAQFRSELFVFVVRSDFAAKEFVGRRASLAGIERIEIVELSDDTRGQADTVAIALASLPEDLRGEALTIFNADSFLLEFEMPSSSGPADGLVEVFEGEGEHWSFVEPGEDNSVLRTTEKERISSLCSNGLYWFRSGSIFLQGFEAMKAARGQVNGELYVAPLYNYLISQGYDIQYRVTPIYGSVFCGIPSEYEELRLEGWTGF